MLSKRVVSVILFLNSFALSVFSQQQFLQLNNDIYSRYDNLVYNKTPNFHTSIKPYLMNEIQGVSQADSSLLLDTKNEFFNTVLNKNIIGFDKNSIKININPIFTSVIEYEARGKQGYSNINYGLSVNGDLGKKLSFASNIFQSGLNYPDYLSDGVDTTGFVPYYGKYDRRSDDTYVFNTFTGYLSYSPSKIFNFQFGKDKNFWGDGYRSILLSDNSNSHPFLKASVNIWKIKYVVLYSAYKDIDTGSDLYYNDFDLIEKYSTSHYLSWNISRKFNINLFETVIWRGEDSLGYRGFDVNYLNPIIFFRPVEYSLGSPDNVIMGAGFKWNAFKATHFYAQALIDEFVLGEIKADIKHLLRIDEETTDYGWWANKYSFQLGFKTFDLFSIKNLFLLSEYNYCRPFTYSHMYSMNNYGNYYRPMAHPLGSNYREFLSLIKYGRNRWSFSGKVIYTGFGTNKNGVNYGQDIYLSYKLKEKDYGHTTTQGLKNKVIYNELKAAYLINPKANLQIEAGVRNRMFRSDIKESNHTFIFVGLRTNLYNDHYDL